MGAIVQRLSSTPRTQPLPRGWTRSIRSAVLHIISLAHYAGARACGKAAVSISPFLRTKAENARLRQKLAQLQEEVRIKHASMCLLPPHRRPHYPPTERMARRRANRDKLRETALIWNELHQSALMAEAGIEPARWLPITGFQVPCGIGTTSDQSNVRDDALAGSLRTPNPIGLLTHGPLLNRGPESFGS